MSLMNKSIFLMTKLQKHNIPVFPRLMQQMNRLIFATDVPRTVEIGKGTKFAHSGLGCVIHERAIIGDNCKILQNVTIGGRSKHGTPVIGNNVLIGAGATILGGITIGNNVKIGAQALVMEDVQDNQTIVAQKGTILKK